LLPVCIKDQRGTAPLIPVEKHDFVRKIHQKTARLLLCTLKSTLHTVKVKRFWSTFLLLGMYVHNLPVKVLALSFTFSNGDVFIFLHHPNASPSQRVFVDHAFFHHITEDDRN
jgi:hypothetical protein